MGILDSIEGLTKEFSQGGDHAAVTSGLLDQVGGVNGVMSLIQQFHQNGAGGLIQQMANGQTQALDPNTIQQALAGSGIIEGVAQRTGISADTVRSSLAVVVPLLVNHVTSAGHVTTDGQPASNPMPSSGALIQSVLGKLLG